MQSRPYQREHDYPLVLNLLTSSYQNYQRMYNWSNSHWDRSDFVRKAHLQSIGDQDWEESAWVWETDQDQLVGVVHLEPGEGICLQIDPDYRFLEDTMFAWAEARIMVKSPGAPIRGKCSTQVFDYDRKRATVLANRGYTNSGLIGSTYRRTLNGRLPGMKLPEGYAVHQVRNAGDVASRAILQKQICGNDWTIEIMQLLRQAPAYRQDLDLVVVSPEGATVAFCTAWLDDQNRIGEIEPVVVDPHFRRIGLAGAIVSEILIRLKRSKARMAYVIAGDELSENRLWEKMGFDGIDASYVWLKQT